MSALVTPARGASVALLVAGVAAIAGLAWHHMALLGDGFWMIASGRWLLEHRALPHVDPFSFASAGDRWIVVSSGDCVLFASVVRLFGLHGLLAGATAIEALAVGALWWGSARSSFARAALLPLALFFVHVDAEDLSARGQIFGDLGFVLLLGAMARLREGRRVHPAIVLAGAALWTVLHVSFLMVLAVPLLVALALRAEPRDARPSWRPFAWFAFVALAGTLLNPYGPRYLVFAVRCAIDPTAAAFDLFRSPNFLEPQWLAAPVLGVALVLARPALAGSRFVRSEQVLLLVFVAAACVSRRYATQLVAVEVAVLGAVLDRLEPRRWTGALAPVVAVVSGGLAIVWLRERRDPLRDVPVAAAAVARDVALAREGAGLRDRRVVDPLHWGGYLGYAWAGSPRYFIDGRDQIVLYGNGAYDDSAVLWAGGPGWDSLLDTYEAGVVLWERGAWLDRTLRADPRWRLVHEDPIAVVHVRADSR